MTTALVTLLPEAGMVAGRFKPNDLFAVRFDKIQVTLKKRHMRLGILVGIHPAKCDLSPTANVWETSSDSQMKLQDIDVHSQMQETTRDPRSIHDKSQETMPPCAHVVARQSSQGSSSNSRVSRTPLRQTGAAFVHPRARHAERDERTHETVTGGQPTESQDLKG